VAEPNFLSVVLEWAVADRAAFLALPPETRHDGPLRFIELSDVDSNGFRYADPVHPEALTYPHSPTWGFPGDENSVRQRADDAMRADPVLSQLHGKIIGGARRTVELNALNLASQLIPEGFVRDSDEVLAERIQRRYDAFLDAANGADLDARLIIPIQVYTDDVALPVPIGPRAEIRYLTDDEIERCALLETFERMGDPPGRFLVTHAVGLVLNCTDHLAVLDPEDAPAHYLMPRPPWSLTFDDWNERRVEDAITAVRFAMRLGGVTRVGLTGAAYILDKQVPFAHFLERSSRITPATMATPRWQLDRVQARRIRFAWWLCRTRLASQAVPQVVLGRFASALEHGVDDDSLLDLVIALEGLVIRSNTQELTYRASLIVALLCHFGDVEDGVSKFHLVRAAYGARSRIAHGGEAKAQVAFGQPSVTADFADFVGLVDDATREAVTRWLYSLSEYGAKGPPDEFWIRRALESC
jgi:hypothetical protein